MLAKRPYPIDKIVLSHSSRSTLRRCLRLFEFRKMYGRPATARDDNYSAEVGKALHHGLGVFLTTNDRDKAVVEFLIQFPLKLEYLKAGNEQRSLEAAYSAFMALLDSPFISKYAIAQIQTSQGVKPCIEVPFAIEITGAPLDIPVYFVGFIDEIMHDPLRNKFVVFDLKTTRQKFSDYEYRFTWDEQTIPYAIVLEHALGALIDDFDVNYLSVFIDLMEPVITEYPVPKKQEHILDWHRGLCDDVALIAKCYNRQWFPRVTDGQTCIVWNRKCEFMDECGYRDPEIIKRILQADPQPGLFPDPKMVPWIVATLPYVEG